MNAKNNLRNQFRMNCSNYKLHVPDNQKLLNKKNRNELKKLVKKLLAYNDLYYNGQ